MPDHQDLPCRVLPHAQPELDIVYTELRRIASRYMTRENRHHTLRPTDLVHEAYLKLRDGRSSACNDRRHFVAVAARAMRQILVDHARRKRAAKHHRGQQVHFDETLGLGSRHSACVLDIDQLIERLKQMDRRVAKVVELRVFAGLTIAGVAQALRLSSMTVTRDWRVARAWMAKELELSVDS